MYHMRLLGIWTCSIQWRTRQHPCSLAFPTRLSPRRHKIEHYHSKRHSRRVLLRMQRFEDRWGYHCSWSAWLRLVVPESLTWRLTVIGTGHVKPQLLANQSTSSNFAYGAVLTIETTSPDACLPLKWIHLMPPKLPVSPSFQSRRYPLLAAKTSAVP